ncbi:MAG: hypothetical protein ACI835_000278 [Planctomycetota bacterium]|jgi:hypothetical protein
MLASDPPGAQIFLDGKDTGFLTPRKLKLPFNEDKRLDFVLPGYQTATRMIGEGSIVYALLWRDMNVGQLVWRFPLWLGIEDLLIPIKATRIHKPGRVFVRLRRAAGPREASADR